MENFFRSKRCPQCRERIMESNVIKEVPRGIIIIIPNKNWSMESTSFVPLSIKNISLYCQCSLRVVYNTVYYGYHCLQKKIFLILLHQNVINMRNKYVSDTDFKSNPDQSRRFPSSSPTSSSIFPLTDSYQSF